MYMNNLMLGYTSLLMVFTILLICKLSYFNGYLITTTLKIQTTKKKIYIYNFAYNNSELLQTAENEVEFLCFISIIILII